MSIWHGIGIVGILALIVILGVLSKRQVENAADFESGGGRAGLTVVIGVTLGTVLGGSSTIGTTQLAYTHGLSALWFTLGNCVGCLLIALFFSKPFRHSGSKTIIGSLRKEYGNTVGLIVSVLVSLGMFINIIAQLISAIAVIPTLFPRISTVAALILAAGLMLAYVIFGGTLSVGRIGQVKTLLIYFGIILSIIIILGRLEPKELWMNLDHQQYLNFFARGFKKDFGNFISVVIGVITGQAFFIAALSACSDAIARRAIMISAFFIPPVGIGSALIGIFMQERHPGIEFTKNVFPQFVIDYFPDLLGGVFLGTLLITIVGTGAGIALAASTIIKNDVIGQFHPDIFEPRRSLMVTRISIVVILAGGCCLSTGILGDVILEFSSMSMALWGVVILAPLLFAYILPGRLSSKWVLVSAIVSPLLVLLFTVIPVLPFDPLFAGIIASFICCAFGLINNSEKN